MFAPRSPNGAPTQYLALLRQATICWPRDSVAKKVASAQLCKTLSGRQLDNGNKKA